MHTLLLKLDHPMIFFASLTSSSMVRYHIECIVSMPEKAHRKHNFIFTEFLNHEVEPQSERSNMDVLRAIWNEVFTCMQGTCQ
jgi:hypothetical protein